MLDENEKRNTESHETLTDKRKVEKQISQF